MLGRRSWITAAVTERHNGMGTDGTRLFDFRRNLGGLWWWNVRRIALRSWIRNWKFMNQASLVFVAVIHWLFLSRGVLKDRSVGGSQILFWRGIDCHPAGSTDLRWKSVNHPCLQAAEISGVEKVAMLHCLSSSFRACLDRYAFRRPFDEQEYRE